MTLEVTPERDESSDFAGALGVAVARRELTLTALRARLSERGQRVSLATLSYWLNGQRVPSTPASLEVVEHLETILDTAPGELSGRIRRRKPGRPQAELAYTDFTDTPAVIDESLAELGLLRDYGLDEVSAHLVVQLDAEGLVVAVTNRQVLQATRDGADRLPAVLIDDVPFETPPQIEALRGCSLGRRIDHLQAGASVVEILLPTPLPFRGTTVVETRLHFTPVAPDEDSNEFGYHLTCRLRQCAIWVQFDAESVPEYGHAYTVTADGTRTPVASQLTDSDLQTVVHDFGPGRLFVAWEW